VHYDKLGLRVKAPGDLTDIELDEALDGLIARTQSQESSCLQQLEIISSALNKISEPSIKHCSVLNDNVTKKSEELKDTIRDYFQSNSPLTVMDTNSQVCFSIKICFDLAIWQHMIFFLSFMHFALPFSSFSFFLCIIFIYLLNHYRRLIHFLFL
jgi:hypothetical protein